MQVPGGQIFILDLILPISSISSVWSVIQLEKRDMRDMRDMREKRERRERRERREKQEKTFIAFVASIWLIWLNKARKARKGLFDLLGLLRYWIIESFFNCGIQIADCGLNRRRKGALATSVNLSRRMSWRCGISHCSQKPSQIQLLIRPCPLFQESSKGL